MDISVLLVGAIAFVIGLIIGRLSAPRPQPPQAPQAGLRRASTLTMGERAEINSLIQQGNKIEAIKRYRQLTGYGLKEAKAAIDQWSDDY